MPQSAPLVQIFIHTFCRQKSLISTYELEHDFTPIGEVFSNFMRKSDKNLLLHWSLSDRFTELNRRSLREFLQSQRFCWEGIEMLQGSRSAECRAVKHRKFGNDLRIPIFVFL